MISCHAEIQEIFQAVKAGENKGELVVISDMLMSRWKNPKEEVLDFVNTVSHNPQIQFSQKIVHLEKPVGYRNIALCKIILNPMEILKMSKMKLLEMFTTQIESSIF